MPTIAVSTVPIGGIEAPPANIANVTPDDGNELAFVTRALSFAAAGTLRVLTVGGQDVTIPSGALSAGCLNPMLVRKVFSTGTTATGIVAYW